MSKYKWISWFQPGDDHRPINFPPDKRVLGWWKTGERSYDSASTLVSLVLAKTEEEALSILKIDWPEVDEVRFCEDKNDTKLSDRFPIKEWMPLSDA
jgi:hypothetical protein